MMIFRRPVSSPGRVEKYPPPLMGFLRSKSRSRSKGKSKSRASPLFVRRNKSSAAAVTQEPSSPKVTCMGQVRIKPKKITKPDEEDPTTRKSKCEWIRKFSDRIKTMSFRPNWISSSSLFPCSCRKSKDSHSPTRTESVQEVKEEEEEEEEREEFKIPKVFVSSLVSSTPPFNAFLLTRSRSAPYGASSLAYRFWEENKQREEEEEEARKREAEGFVRRPELTRSKSEPARRGGEKKMV